MLEGQSLSRTSDDLAFRAVNQLQNTAPGEKTAGLVAYFCQI
jgi:hypothetical protein